jgi:hypothetical protein
MTSTFRKGDRVTLLMDWDREGTVRVADLTVHSCGRKQMVLVDDAGVQFERRFFQPTMLQPGGSCAEGGVAVVQVYPQLDPAVAETLACGLGAAVVTEQRAHFEARIAEATAQQFAYWQGYVASMQRSLAALHAPRMVRL